MIFRSVYDVIMIATTTVWVPLVTAGVGLVTGVGAALGAAFLTERRADRREELRWQREREDRQEQWQRERGDRQGQWQREDSLRWLQERHLAYARFLGALYEWDARLRDAFVIRRIDSEQGTWTDLDMAKIKQAAEAASVAMDSVRLMASRQVGEDVLMSWGFHEAFPVSLADKALSYAELARQWSDVLPLVLLTGGFLPEKLAVKGLRLRSKRGRTARPLLQVRSPGCVTAETASGQVRG